MGRAIELARLIGIHGGFPVALVEANLRGPSRLAAALGVDVMPGLATALAQPDKAADAVRPTHDPRLFVMTSGTDKPAPGPPSADEFARVTAALRSGSWARDRAVVDLHDGKVTELPGPPAPPPPPPLPGPPPGLPVAVPSGEAQPNGGADGAPALRLSGELRPFNEGPAPTTGTSPVPTRTTAPAPTQAGVHLAVPGGGRSPAVTVVLSPPLDELTDGDIVVRQCDELVLVVHAGRTSRDALVEAMERCGPSRVIGTVLVTPARQPRRLGRRAKRP